MMDRQETQYTQSYLNPSLFIELHHGQTLSSVLLLYDQIPAKLALAYSS